MVPTLKFQLLLFPYNIWLFSKWPVISLNEQIFINLYILQTVLREVKSVQSVIMRLFLCRTWSLHEQDSRGSLRTLQLLNPHNFVTNIFSREHQEWLHYTLYSVSCYYYRNPSLPHYLSCPRTLIFFHAVYHFLWPQLPFFPWWRRTFPPPFSLNLLLLIYHHLSLLQTTTSPRVIIPPSLMWGLGSLLFSPTKLLSQLFEILPSMKIFPIFRSLSNLISTLAQPHFLMSVSQCLWPTFTTPPQSQHHTSHCLLVSLPLVLQCQQSSKNEDISDFMTFKYLLAP